MDKQSLDFLKENFEILNDIHRLQAYLSFIAKIKKEEISPREFWDGFRDVLEFRKVSKKKFNNLYKKEVGEDFPYFDELIEIVRKHSYHNVTIPFYTICPSWYRYYKPKETYTYHPAVVVKWKEVFEEIEIDQHCGEFFTKPKGNILNWSLL